MYINIHSHFPVVAEETTLQNIHKNFELPLGKGRFSVGLHPWYIQAQSWRKEFQQISFLAQQPKVLAIGECGLDKVCTTPLMLQQDVFAAHIQLANAVKKPLILHCVRAHGEALAMLANHSVNVPVIFHGFRNKWSIAEKIVTTGHYLSFGTSLELPVVQQVLKRVPIEQLFLETDDAQNCIESIYAAAAGIKNLPVESLLSQLEQNFKKVFKQ